MKENDLNKGQQNQLKGEIVESAYDKFKHFGYKSVTMDDIARGLGISKKTLYEEIGNKQALINLVLDVKMDTDDRAIEQIRRDTEDAVLEMLNIARYFIETLRDVNPASLYDLQKYYRKSWEKLDKHNNEKMLEHIKANLLRGQQEGNYREDLHLLLIAQLFLSMPKTILNPQQIKLKQTDWEFILNQLMLYHLLGVCTPAGRTLLYNYLNRNTIA